MNPNPIKQSESSALRNSGTKMYAKSTSKEREPNLTLVIIGLIMFFGGILAFAIPPSLVPPGSGDTEAFGRRPSQLSAWEYRY